MPVRQFIFIGLIIFVSSANSEIYRWKDSQGNVYFSDRPVSQSAEEVTLKRDISEETAEKAQQKSQAFVDRQKQKTAFQNEEKQKADQERRKQEQSKKQLAQYCKSWKSDLAKLKLALPVYRSDEGGERSYLGDSQRKKEIAQLSAKIGKYCGA